MISTENVGNAAAGMTTSLNVSIAVCTSAGAQTESPARLVEVRERDRRDRGDRHRADAHRRAEREHDRDVGGRDERHRGHAVAARNERPSRSRRNATPARRAPRPGRGRRTPRPAATASRDAGRSPSRSRPRSPGTPARRGRTPPPPPRARGRPAGPAPAGAARSRNRRRVAGAVPRPRRSAGPRPGWRGPTGPWRRPRSSPAAPRRARRSRRGSRARTGATPTAGRGRIAVAHPLFHRHGGTSRPDAPAGRRLRASVAAHGVAAHHPARRSTRVGASSPTGRDVPSGTWETPRTAPEPDRGEAGSRHVGGSSGPADRGEAGRPAGPPRCGAAGPVARTVARQRGRRGSASWWRPPDGARRRCCRSGPTTRPRPGASSGSPSTRPTTIRSGSGPTC